jgi:shikimate kinase
MNCSFGNEIFPRARLLPCAKDKVVEPARQIENIALIGFMGTGKSSVGHALAHLLHFKMVDTDDLVERQAGKRITEIFRTEGEARFREYERQTVSELAHLRQTVIATGGGLGANPEHVASLKAHALVVCLWASPERIWERVRHQTHRPLLDAPDPLDKIRRLLADRGPTYRRADVLMNTEVRSVRELALQIAHQYRQARQAGPRESDYPTAGP